MSNSILRRSFLASVAAGGAMCDVAAAHSANKDKERGVAATGTPSNEAILAGGPVVSGPASAALAVLQPLAAPATGYMEFSVDDGPALRVDTTMAGLLPYDRHVLKFALPPLPAGKTVRYRVNVRGIDFKDAYHITPGAEATSGWRTFRTLDGDAAQTRFVIWNDTHENQETIAALVRRTAEVRPDFLLWNGDQTNDIYDEDKMVGQFLAPGGLEIAADWPLAYARGNHDARGPLARKLPEFTGTPRNEFYYAFRSGPVAMLVMDTGEDKPDDHPVFAGLAAFERRRREQRAWLAQTVREPWFREAPFRLLCCHIPLWWKDEVTDVGHWRFSKVCRDAWLPELERTGVKVVVSGHTHEYAWLPAGKERGIGQLIGGGPRPSIATIIEGAATNRRLTLTMKKLDGTAIETLEFQA